MGTTDGRAPGARAAAVARADEPDETAVVDLGPAPTESVRPVGSWWVAVLIGLFTALTCAGLVGRVAEPPRSAEPPRLAAEAGPVGDPSPSSLLRVPQASGAIGAVEPGPAPVGVTAVAFGPDAALRVRGWAPASVARVEAILVLGGHVVGGQRPTVRAVGPNETGAGRGSWIAVFELPTDLGETSADATAFVEIRWPASSAGAGGAMTAVVALGDGRGGD